MSFTLAEIKTGVAEIIAEEVGYPASDITEAQTLTGDLDVDSLDRLSIVTQAEDQFRVIIPDAEIATFATVGDLVNFIAAQTEP